MLSQAIIFSIYLSLFNTEIFFKPQLPISIVHYKQWLRLNSFIHMYKWQKYPLRSLYFLSPKDPWFKLESEDPF